MDDAGDSAAGDVDLMEELLSGDFWLGSPDDLDLLEPAAPSFGPLEVQVEEDDNNNNSNNQEGRLELASRRLAPIVPLKERLWHALGHIKQSQRESEVLIQLWVPTRIGGRDFLTTCDQPFWLDQGCRSLSSYRTASLGYRFSATEDPGQTLGLPGRVFTGRVPEWTPDVRYFSTPEYPRVGHAQRCDVRGTVALPVFERGSRSCVAVVEVVSTAQKINYGSDVENICSALQAVDLRSSDVLDASCIKESNNSYEAALPEILNVLRVVCETHCLPLAQTWIPCIQQGKQGSRHSEDNYRDCVSTVDGACYVKEASVLGFHKACSEYHLFRGQGVVGEAFTTNQPCFSPDITSIIKTKYPLSHHAKLFGLRGAVAIRLRSIFSGNADFVVEFFLPVDCEGSEEQKLMLNSLSVTIQQVCQSLRVVTAKELEDETVLQPNGPLPSDVLLDKYFSEAGGQRQPDMETTLGYFPSIEVTGEVPSWVASIIEAEDKEEISMLPSSLTLESSKRVVEEFSDTTNWEPPKELFPDEKVSSKPEQLRQDTGKDTNDRMDSLPSEPNFSNAGKTTEKRRAKMEKTVSLQVLRQYFAGSLKDAAKGIGVCPTTLKRICRQHGINRWPSRKIKKVGHSLKKLQVVIDSVHGAKGTFQFSSLYDNFAKPPTPNEGSTILSTLKPTDNPESSKALQQQEGIFNFHTSTSNSLSSSCSHSSSSSLGCSSGSKQGVHAPQIAIKQETPIEEKRTIKLKRVHSNVEMQFSTPEPLETLSRSVSHNILAEKISLGKPSQPQRETGLLKVKAIYGEEKVRFRLQLGWGFQELKQEIIKRFNISDLSPVNLKYLDDDSEWVLLTCDADLQECIDVYKTSSSDTVRISVHSLAPSSTRNSFTLPGLS